MFHDIITGKIENKFNSVFVRCYNSNKLFDLETLLQLFCKNYLYSKVGICLLLAKIKTQKLYLQANTKSFKGYLKAKRIPLHYHTAHEYAKIGETFMQYRRDLDDVQFNDECGLKKLLLLENALAMHPTERKLVFQTLKEATFQEFRNFSKTTSIESARADSKVRDHPNDIEIQVREECIAIIPADKEVVWFDPDLVRTFGSDEMANKFKRHLYNAVRQFIKSETIDNRIRSSA